MHKNQNSEPLNVFKWIFLHIKKCQNWFHVKFEWWKNSEISTLWLWHETSDKLTAPIDKQDVWILALDWRNEVFETEHSFMKGFRKFQMIFSKNYECLGPPGEKLRLRCVRQANLKGGLKGGIWPFLGILEHSVEISEIWCHPYFTWNQLCLF